MRVKYILPLLCYVLLSSLWAMPAYAAVVFTEDFEVTTGAMHASGSQPVIDLQAKGWAGYIEGSSADTVGGDPIGQIMTKTGRSGSSTKVIRYAYGQMSTIAGGGNDFKNAKITRFFPGMTEIWTRAWMRWEKRDPALPSFWIGGQISNSKQQYINPGLGEATGAYAAFHSSWAGNEIMLQTATSFTRNCRPGSPTGNAQSCNYMPNKTSVPMTLHTSTTDRPTEWACVEVHLKFNDPLATANGIVEMYVNNIQTIYYNDVVMSENPPSGNQTNTFRYLQLYRQSAENMYRYEDDWAVSSTRVGCSGTIITDTQPPAAPSISSIAKTSTTTTVTFTGANDVTMGTYLMLRCTGASCTSHTQVGSVNHVQGTTTYTFTNTGLTPSTVYSYRVRAQDTAGNLSSLSGSNTMEVTTDASSALPNITSFTTSSSGGTVTWSTSPATVNVKFDYGGTLNGVAFSASVSRTIGQLPGGVLSFQWPSGTTYACAKAGNGVPTYNEDSAAYRCGPVTPQASVGPGLLRVHPTNHRWFTQDGVKALVLTGSSTGSDLHSSFNQAFPSGLIARQTSIETFDGTSTDISTNFTPGPLVAQRPLTKVSGVVQPTDVSGYEPNSEVYNTFEEADGFRCMTLGTFNDVGAAKASVYLRASVDGSDNFYEFRIQRNFPNNASIRRVAAGITTTLVSDTTSTGAPGDEFCAYAVGSHLYFHKNGTLISGMDTTDSTYRHGSSGIALGGTNAASSTTITSTRAGYFDSDGDAGLNTVVANGGNWARGWKQEGSVWGNADTLAANTTSRVPLSKFPWTLTDTRLDTTTGTSIRVGVYDLNIFNQAYFDNIRNIVIAANAKGVTLSIMLFNPGHQGSYFTYAGFAHPMSCPTAARCNNEQGINADTNANGLVTESYLAPASNPVYNDQVVYINKMVDTLHDLNGFFYEVGNELFTDGTSWHNGVYDAVRAREVAMGYQQHLVWYSSYGWNPPVFTTNAYLRNNARPDVIAPGTIGIVGEDWVNNPPTNGSTEPTHIVIVDTDHFSVGVDALWPWKVFLRENHPALYGAFESAPVLAAIRQSQRQVLTYSEKMDLASMSSETTSSTNVFSTTFGLTGFTGGTACKEYITLIQTDIAGTIDLTKYGCTGATTFDVEYLNVTTGAVTSGGTTTGGAVRSFNPAGSDPMVVYLKAQGGAADTTPPILSGGFPSGMLVAGTTSTPMNVISTEACEAKYDNAPGVAHASKASTFSTTNVVSHTTTVGGLTDGTAHLKYVTCKDPAGNVSTEFPIAWAVSAAVDTELPSSVSSLVGLSTLNDTAILWQLGLATDNVAISHYILEISSGETFDTLVASAQIQSGGLLEYLQQGLVAGRTYTARAKAVDTNGNLSSLWIISPPVLVSIPETMSGLTVMNIQKNSASVTMTAPLQGGSSGTFEICTGAACNSGWVSAGIPSGTSATFIGLLSGTTYGVRGKWVNLALGGISAAWSNTLYFTTNTDGLDRLRNSIVTPRTPAGSGVSAGPRTPR